MLRRVVLLSLPVSLLVVHLSHPIFLLSSRSWAHSRVFLLFRTFLFGTGKMRKDSYSRERIKLGLSLFYVQNGNILVRFWTFLRMDGFFTSGQPKAQGRLISPE